jgi:hypothetical protein
MSTEPNNNLSQEAPQWLRDVFEELKDMFEGLFPDADKLDLEEMQRQLDEQQGSLEKTADDHIGVGAVPA